MIETQSPACTCDADKHGTGHLFDCPVESATQVPVGDVLFTYPGSLRIVVHNDGENLWTDSSKTQRFGGPTAYYPNRLSRAPQNLVPVTNVDLLLQAIRDDENTHPSTIDLIEKMGY